MVTVEEPAPQIGVTAEIWKSDGSTQVITTLPAAPVPPFKVPLLVDLEPEPPPPGTVPVFPAADEVTLAPPAPPPFAPVPPAPLEPEAPFPPFAPATVVMFPILNAAEPVPP